MSKFNKVIHFIMNMMNIQLIYTTVSVISVIILIYPSELIYCKQFLIPPC